MFNKREKSLKKKIVLITSCPNSKNFVPEAHPTKKRFKRFFRDVYSVLKKFPEYKLIVKGKEGWDMNNLPIMIAREESYNIEFVTNIDPIRLLFDADIVIINVTTMVIDALILNKPVISYYWKDLDYQSGLEETKAIKKVYNQKQLEQAIKECQNQTEEETIERKKYLEEELFKLDGKSSERIAKFINSFF